MFLQGNSSVFGLAVCSWSGVSLSPRDHGYTEWPPQPWLKDVQYAVGGPELLDNQITSSTLKSSGCPVNT